MTRPGGDTDEQPRVVIRDRRRLDPETGEVRTAVPDAPPPVEAAVGTPGAAAETTDDGGAADQVVSADEVLLAQLAERTDDLLRVKAEFDNYRRRMDRDRAGWGEAAVGRLLADLLPALDDADRAEQHGELTGAFRTVVDALVKVAHGAGLERFGTAGEPFDPARHEALTSVPTPGAESESVAEVYRAGYSYAGRVLRPAQVVVSSPA